MTVFTAIQMPQKLYHFDFILVITIVDVNDFPPAFLEPWTPQSPYLNISIPEEQPKGTIVYTFRATDADSNIDR